MEDRTYEVLIIGGGISGGTLLYDLALHSDVQSMCLIEKYDHLDPLNSMDSGFYVAPSFFIFKRNVLGKKCSTKKALNICHWNF